MTTAKHKESLEDLAPGDLSREQAAEELARLAKVVGEHDRAYCR